jgi:hypothetical protein
VTSQEASQLITAIAESLQKHPEQFSLNVSVIGDSRGGPGIVGMATGGAPGSSATGYRSEASSGDITIEKRVNGAVNDEIAKVIVGLRELAADVCENGGRHQTILARLNSYARFPASVGSVISTALQLASL